MHCIVFSHLRWAFVYQRPQHLMSRLAACTPVWFLEEPVFDEGEPWLERSSPVAGVTVLRPHTPVAAPGFHDDQLGSIRLLLRDLIAASDLVDYIAWFYTPMALPLIADLHPSAVVFDCMDELSAFKGAPLQLRQRETALLRRADLVLTGGPSLYEAKRHRHPNVLCLPSAVDAAHYAPGRLGEQPEHAAEASRLQGHLAGPRLGYFGVIDERFDVELLTALVDARPAWHFVLVGPVVKIDESTLPRRPNLTWLGQQPYELLPQLVAGWDVCLLPFALNESTRFISPTKTLEYLAAEKPVVSTAVHDVLELYGDVVRVRADIPSFIAACEEALAEGETERRARIRKSDARVARYSWDRTVEVIEDTVAAAVEMARVLPPRREVTGDTLSIAKGLHVVQRASTPTGS